MLISGYILEDCICFIRIYFWRLHILISGYISGECIYFYQHIFQEIAYAYIENKNEKITAAWLQDGEYQIGEIRWGGGRFLTAPLELSESERDLHLFFLIICNIIVLVVPSRSGQSFVTKRRFPKIYERVR